VVSRWLESWRRNRLFRKYVVPFVAVVLLALLSNGLLEIYFAFQENKSALAQIQREKAMAAALRIEGFVKEIERQMGWTTQPHFGAGGGLEQRRLDYVRLLRQVPPITEVAYLDAQGREQLRVSRLAMDVLGAGADRAAEPRFTETRTGKTWYGPVYFRKESEPYMALAIPHGSGGAVSAAEVNLKFIWDVVSQIRIGKFGHAYVVDAGGHLIAHPDISLVLKKTDLSRLPQIQAARAAPMPTGEGWDEGMIATSLDGRRSLVAHTAIAPLGWLVVVEQPLIEAFAPLRGSILRTGLLMVLGVLISVAASLVLARKMARPIQALHAGAARIGGGDLAHQIDVKTRDELEDLAGEFNRMTARLRESHATLEQRVEERTRELRETLDQQTATAEILGVISSSPTDVRPVMEVLVKSAATLCDAQNAQLFRVEDGRMRLVARWGPVKSSLEAGEARAITRASVSGRTIVDGVTIHEPDLLAVVDGEYGDIAPATQRERIRTTIGVPLMREGTAIGSITAFRTEVKPFTDKQIALLQTFADQAVIAIENVRLFNEIQDKTRQLEAANRHKDEFLASMSHELRTPLNAVIGFSEVLLERMFGEINAKQEEYLDDILSSGRHLLSLINDILDLAKIEAGRMELDLEDFELAQAIDNAVVLVRERATRKGLLLETALGPRLGQVRGDQRKIKQVLLNLLSNAVKFTPEGGRVDVQAQRLDGHVEISVTDTGIGIAADDQEAVFEEFRQVGTDYAKKHEGTGLGLTLSRKFVELHGGHIAVKSRLGEGATFTFTLPVSHG
jgi:signal transduction histidine kinase/HAMP domain-containing protein